jgi:pyruvate/2-oxoglutarate dehydrogenase complex dihydrolipoamide acyltransferase (E2) component
MIEQSPSTAGNYEVRPFPRMRQLVLDAGWLGHRRHMIHGFIEVDVTYPRQLIRERAAQDGRKLSFTAFVLTCIGQAVEQDRSVQAMRDWRNRLIIFDDVDVLITIEIPVGNSTFPLVHPIRAVNHRSVEDIHSEILNVTLSFDHDTIDGAPAARFANSFQQYIEAGFGLTSGFSS